MDDSWSVKSWWWWHWCSSPPECRDNVGTLPSEVKVKWVLTSFLILFILCWINVSDWRYSTREYNTNTFFMCICWSHFPWVLWHCWLGDRKGIRPVKSWVLVCRWWQYDWSFARVVAPLVATTTFLAAIKSRMETFWYRLTQVYGKMAVKTEWEREAAVWLCCLYDSCWYLCLATGSFNISEQWSVELKLSESAAVAVALW